MSGVITANISVLEMSGHNSERRQIEMSLVDRLRGTAPQLPPLTDCGLWGRASRLGEDPLPLTSGHKPAGTFLLFFFCLKKQKENF